MNMESIHPPLNLENIIPNISKCIYHHFQKPLGSVLSRDIINETQGCELAKIIATLDNILNNISSDFKF